MYDAAWKLDTSWAHVWALSPRNSGRFAGSTIVRPAVNMVGVAVRHVAT